MIANSQTQKEKFKKSSWEWRNQTFLLSMHKVGLRLICIHVTVPNVVILDQNEGDVSDQQEKNLKIAKTTDIKSKIW